MLDKLFNAGTRLKVLGYFLANTDQEFFIQELLRNLGTDARNVFTELNYLEKLGILISRKQGRERYFQINKNNQYYPSLANLFHVYRQELTDNKPSLDLIVDYHNAHPQILAAGSNVNRINQTLTKYNLSSKIFTVLHEYNRETYKVWINKKEFSNLSVEITNLVMQDKTFTDQLIQDFGSAKQALLDQINLIQIQNLASLNSQELNDLYQKYYQTFEQLSLLQWLFIESDANNLISNNLLNELKKILKGKLDSKTSKYSLEYVLTIMTNDFGASKSDQESSSFIDMLEYIEQRPVVQDYLATTESRLVIQDLQQIDSDLLIKVSAHAKNFGWLYYGYSGPGLDIKYYLELIIGVCRLIKKSGTKNLFQTLKAKTQNNQFKTNQQKQEILNLVQLTDEESSVFQRVSSLLQLGPDCWDTFYLMSSVIENLLREIGQRSFLSLRQVRYVYPGEMSDLILNSKFDRETLNQRYTRSIHYSDSKTSTDLILIEPELDAFLEGFNLVKTEVRSESLIRGFPVSSGLIVGQAMTITDLNQPKKNSEKSSNIPKILILAEENFDFGDYADIQGVVIEKQDLNTDFIAYCRFHGLVCLSGAWEATSQTTSGQDLYLDSSHSQLVILEKS